MDQNLSNPESATLVDAVDYGPVAEDGASVQSDQLKSPCYVQFKLYLRQCSVALHIFHNSVPHTGWIMWQKLFTPRCLKHCRLHHIHITHRTQHTFDKKRNQAWMMLGPRGTHGVLCVCTSSHLFFGSFSTFFPPQSDRSLTIHHNYERKHLFI